MKAKTIGAAIVLAGSLAACTSPAEDDNGTPEPETPEIDTELPGDDAEQGDTSLSDDDAAQPDSDDETPNAPEGTDDKEPAEPEKPEKPEEPENMGTPDSEKSDVDSEQKQMAIDTLNGLVKDGKQGKVYRLTDKFYVGKTTQTDVFNAIGQPEREDTFDRYNGSMGRASYDLRYEDGLLVEARYLGTNVERQTNLGGITSKDLLEQLGNPDTKRPLPDTDQTSYIYNLGNYQIQFVMNAKDTADHVNLLLVS